MLIAQLQHVGSKDVAGRGSTDVPGGDFERQEECPREAVPASGFRCAFGPKLFLNEPGDACERAADDFAARAAGARPHLGARALLRPASGTPRRAVEPDIAAAIARARGGGSPLPPLVRRPMERAFGADLHAVRVHCDARADALNRSLSARAFTTGPDVFFRHATYDPRTRTGRELLAHEVAHAVQQARTTLPGLGLVQRRLMITDSRPPSASAEKTGDILHDEIKTALRRAADEGTLVRSDEAAERRRQQELEVEALVSSPDLDFWIDEALDHANVIERELIDPADVADSRTIVTQIKYLKASPTKSKLPARLERLAGSRQRADRTRLQRALQDAATKLEDFDEPRTIKKVLANANLDDWLDLLLNGAIDYGSVDLADPQQLAPLYFTLKHWSEPDRFQAEVAENRTAAKRAKAEAANWNAYVLRVQSALKRPNARVSKLAVLGRGASVAYYFDANRGRFDPENTIVIGEEQPWRKLRGETGQTNQPMVLNAPRSKQPEDPYAGGLAGRQELSDAIDAVIEAAVTKDRIYAQRIQSVKKETNPDPDAVSYYKIVTDKGVFYAQNVVAGLGIGGHKIPGTFKEPGEFEQWKAANEAPENAVGGGFPRIMDIDTFQRAVAAGKLLPETIKKLIVVGPNAAIDVLTTALRKKYRTIIWVTKSADDPTFLPGTDNTHVKNIYDEVMKHKAKSSKPAKMKFVHNGVTVLQHDFLGSAVSTTGVTVTYGTRGDARRNPAVPEEKVDTVEGDIMVYGLGPDLEPIKKIFGLDPKKPALELVPTYDLNQRFNAVAPQPIDIDIVLTQQRVKPKVLRETARILDEKRFLFDIEDVSDSRAPGPRSKESLPGILPAVIGLQARSKPGDETSLQFIGGAAFRLAEDQKVAYAYITDAVDDLNEHDVATLRAGTAAPPDQASALPAFLDAIDTYLKEIRTLASQAEKGAIPGGRWYPFRQRIKALSASDSLLAAVRKTHAAVDTTTLDARSRRAFGAVFERAKNLAPELLEFVSPSSMRNASGQPALASTRMKAVPSTLPGNIALNDQLAPSRSQVEATSAFMPENANRAVDFVTNDHTVIRYHVAQKYQHVPPIIADYVAARIVYDRRHLPVQDAPLPQPIGADPTEGKFTLEPLRKFQEGWIKKLADLDRLFAPASSPTIRPF